MGKAKQSTLVLCLSLALNLLLFIFLWSGHGQLTDVLQLSELPMSLQGSPAAQERLKNTRLTNVVIPLHPQQEGALIRNFRLWNRFLPCDSTSPSGSSANVTLTLFISTKENVALEQRLLSGFHPRFR